MRIEASPPATATVSETGHQSNVNTPRVRPAIMPTSCTTDEWVDAHKGMRSGDWWRWHVGSNRIVGSAVEYFGFVGAAAASSDELTVLSAFMGGVV